MKASQILRSSLLKWSMVLIMGAGVSLMLLFLSGFFHRKVPADAVLRGGRSAEGLRTEPVRLISQPRFETATGTIKPVHEAAMASKLLAKVVEVNVVAGQAVNVDEVLVRLDDADLQARVKQAEASLAGAQVQHEKANTDLGRASQLKQSKAITQAEYDAVKSAQESAAASVTQAAETLREAQVILNYATIRSPLTGTVIDKQVEVGETVAPGQILLSLFDPTQMQMVASVRESLALKLKPGQLVPARLDALGYECHAKISEVVPEADVISRSFTVKVTGPCPPGAYSGMFGRLMLPLEDEQLLVIPNQAVERVGQLTLVDVVRENVVTRRHVRLGKTIDSDVEVLSGLAAGELVVVR